MTVRDTVGQAVDEFTYRLLAARSAKLRQRVADRLFGKNGGLDALLDGMLSGRLNEFLGDALLLGQNQFVKIFSLFEKHVDTISAWTDKDCRKTI